MVVKKIIQQCKRSGVIALYEDEMRRTQWIGDMKSFYPLYKMPQFDEETLCKAYDISEKQAEKIQFAHSRIPGSINFADVDEGEHVCDPLNMTLVYANRQVQPYMTSQGIKFMDKRYMAAVEDEGETNLEVYERFTKEGFMYFAVKVGLQLVAIIFPIDVVTKSFIETLREVYMRSAAMLGSEGNNE